MSEAPPLVLHVIHHLYMGGMENGLVNLINRMPATSFRHAIACIEDYSDFRQRLTRTDVEVFTLNRSRIGIWGLRRELLRLCRRLRPAIVHSRNMSGLDALLPARVAGVRHCVHGEHGWDVNDLDGKHWKPALLRRLHKPLVNRYITVSLDLQRYLIDRIGVGAARITQIYNGVDTMRFHPAVTAARELLPEGFAGEEAVVVGAVGRIQPVKDQVTLLRAFANVVTEVPELRRRARLAIIGDGPLLPELRRLAQSLGIAELVWLPGAMSEVPAVLRTFDVFVLPSLAEGISNTILEAMASGLPVIATAVGGNVELIDDGKSGRFFQPGDVPALARLLGAYIQDRSLLVEQGRRARELALERFSLDGMVTRYHALYQQLTQADSSPRPASAG